MLEQYSDNISEIEVYPVGKIFRLLFDSSVGKLRIIARSYDAFEQLHEAFSVDNPAQFYVKQYGYKAEPKIYAINKFGYFGSGLVWEILKWIMENYGSLDVLAVSKKCKSYIDEQLTPLKSFAIANKQFQYSISNILDDSGRNNERVKEGKPRIQFRDYQENSIRNLIYVGYGRGLIEIPTAGGKSLILANFCWNLHKLYDRKLKYLVLVPNKQLVSQMHSDFIDYGFSKFNVTKFTAGLKKNEAYNKDAQIIIANRQYLFLNEDKLPKIDVLICDEVHQCCSQASEAFIQRCTAPIKIGCSGTLPRDKYNRWKLLSLFSKIVYEEKITNLQKQGFISNLKITVLDIIDKNVESNTNLLFNLNTKRKYNPDEFGFSEIAFDDAVKAEHMYFSTYYKDLYKPVLNFISQKTGNILILFDKLDIGKSIFSLFKELYPDKSCFYNDGSTKVEDRETIRNYFETNKDNYLFANVQIMSTGINIKQLNAIVFCFNSKSTTRVIQSIGRILRLHEQKEYAELIDCVFNTKYSLKHYKERLKLYKQFYNKSKPDTIVKLTI